MRSLGWPTTSPCHGAAAGTTPPTTPHCSGSYSLSAPSSSPTADADLLDLLRSLGRDSAAWRLLAALHSALPGAGRHLRAAEIGGLLDDLLAGQDPRRGHTPAPLAVPDVLREHGNVTPAALARALHGWQTEARPAQQLVTDAISTAARTGVPAMIEAPTGTGKSLSALAAALSWLDASADHTAIISTYSKQLQSQLAHELAELAGDVPGLLDTTEVVKGSSNRLSLRGLVYTLADASGADVGTAASLIRYTDSVRFRELLAFLLLRLVHPNRTKTYRWAARSVDHADLPAFFSGYLRPGAAGLADQPVAGHARRVAGTQRGFRSPCIPTRSGRLWRHTGW